MQVHYQLNMSDIMGMSWRRFSVLFGAIFTWNAEDNPENALPESYAKAGPKRSDYERAVHEAAGASGAIQRSVDWDAALGREGPDSRAIITTTELLSKSTGAGKTVET